jgi:hypothetical protein
MTAASVPPVPQLELLARFAVELTGEMWNLGRTSDLGAFSRSG